MIASRSKRTRPSMPPIHAPPALSCGNILPLYVPFRDKKHMHACRTFLASGVREGKDKRGTGRAKATLFARSRGGMHGLDSNVSKEREWRMLLSQPLPNICFPLASFPPPPFVFLSFFPESVQPPRMVRDTRVSQISNVRLGGRTAAWAIPGLVMVLGTGEETGHVAWICQWARDRLVHDCRP